MLALTVQRCSSGGSVKDTIHHYARSHRATPLFSRCVKHTKKSTFTEKRQRVRAPPIYPLESPSPRNPSNRAFSGVTSLPTKCTISDSRPRRSSMNALLPLSISRLHSRAALAFCAGLNAPSASSGLGTRAATTAADTPVTPPPRAAAAITAAEVVAAIVACGAWSR